MNEVSIDYSAGDGRVVLFLAEVGDESSANISELLPWAAPPQQLDVLEPLCAGLRRVRVAVKDLSFASCLERANAVYSLLQVEKIRSVVIVAGASTAALALCLALNYPKFVRQLILVNPLLRPHPTRLERIATAIEKRLPLGLPLRVQHEGFDAEPFLQRVRLPVLVIVTGGADHGSAEVVAAKAPLSWIVSVATLLTLEMLWQYVVQFQDVALKFPMRRAG